MNEDRYTVFAECPICKDRRSVTCRRNDLKHTGPVDVLCSRGHIFTLSTEQTVKLRDREHSLG
jgi:hypothetical protein